MHENAMKEKKNFIFGRIFLVANRLQVLGDQIVSEDMTIRQWLLMALIAQYKKQPTLNAISEVMGTSHQNVKQLSIKLIDKGFLSFERDKQDRRAICFVLEDKCYEFWERRQKEVSEFLCKLFEDMKPEEIDILKESIIKLCESLSKRKLLLKYDRRK